ncbi:MAG: hypothetical protein QOG68_2520, partial [Solirubrobacteraceae bacterium]|nr:hypothetical protein [Solirubrobacteraceae bacterium]
MATVRNAVVRIARAWRALAVEQRHAALAALALLVTMILPWYSRSTFDEKIHRQVGDNLNAFGVFGWVEAAVFLVSLGVLMLLFYRAEQRAFHLPGGDGTVIFGAGLWAAFLFLWRVFDRPSATGTATTIGIAWGFFFAFIAAGALAFAGFRLRAAARAEPTAAQDPTTRQEPAPPPRPELTHTT